jgi:peptide-methionine (S)-S-oxide reductase
MPNWSRQYRSAIFYHNEEQERLARESKDSQEELLGRQLYTDIEPFSRFYIAEDYHQKYWLQGVTSLMSEFNRMYPTAEGFINSTAAARLNGYVGGYGTMEALNRDLDSFGLTEVGKEELLKIAGRDLSAGCAVP